MRPLAHGNGAGRNQAHDEVLKMLAVAGVVLVPDDEVDRQPLQPPVRVRLHHLAHEQCFIANSVKTRVAVA